MLMPKKSKYRKAMKGRVRGLASRGNYIAFGKYGLQSTTTERVTSRQIEAARRAMTRYAKRGGSIWIRIFPHTPVSRKPTDVKWVAARVTQNFMLLRFDLAQSCSKWMEFQKKLLAKR